MTIDFHNILESFFFLLWNSMGAVNCLVPTLPSFLGKL